jgi:hypothetical protein
MQQGRTEEATAHQVSQQKEEKMIPVKSTTRVIAPVIQLFIAL